jgi:hypothetical protein
MAKKLQTKLNNSWKRNSFQIYLHILWLFQDNTSHYNAEVSPAQTARNCRPQLFNHTSLIFYQEGGGGGGEREREIFIQFSIFLSTAAEN